MLAEDDVVTDVRASWERRAKESGAQLSGVLFRGLSESANAAIHAWHTWIVKTIFAPLIPKHGKVLDLGCGYGRISRVLTDGRSDLLMVGQDVALAYCRLYRAEGYSCVCADAANLPYAQASFHAVLAVTCLMYAERSSVPKVLHGLRDLIRPGGALLLLDPGVELQHMVAAVRGNRGRSPTGGSGFARGEYVRLVEEAGFRIVAKGGNPWLSALLLLTGGKGRTPYGFFVGLLGRSLRKDCRRSGYSRFALHRWVVATRLEQDDARV